MITPRSAKSGIQAGYASITSSAPDLAMCSVTAFEKICGKGASTTLTLPPTSCFQSGPEKFFGSSACRPASEILVSFTPLPIVFAPLMAAVAIEEAEAPRRDGDLALLVLVHARPDGKTADERRPPHPPLLVELLEQRRLVDLLELAELDRDRRNGVDLEVDDDLRPERLLEPYEAAQPAVRPTVRSERGVLEVLRPDPDDHLLADALAERRVLGALPVVESDA